MAKMTFRLTITEEWSLVAAGSSYSALGLVSVSGSALLFIGDTDPESDETETIEISASDTREIAIDIPTAMSAWVRSERGDASVQGYRVPV
jgi:hypothetical protein